MEKKGWAVSALVAILGTSGVFGLAGGSFTRFWNEDTLGVMAMAATFLVIGFFVGYLFRPEESQAVQELRDEIERLKREKQDMIGSITADEIDRLIEEAEDAADLARAAAEDDGERLSMDEVMTMCEREP